MLWQLVQHPSNGLDMLFALVLSVDEDVIEKHHYENVELLDQDLVDVTLNRGRYIGQSKRYDLVLKIAKVGPEGRFPFIAFPDPHLMVGVR